MNICAFPDRPRFRWDARTLRIDGMLLAVIAHLSFVTIQPIDGGNLEGLLR
jgi:hypothetical protein